CLLTILSSFPTRRSSDLSDRMFYLNSGIHFHKVEVPMLIHQKFDGASTFIAYCFRAFNGRSAHFFAKFISNERGGGFFYKFLMTSLYGAIPLRQVAGSSVAITDHLDFYMAGFFYKFLQIQAIVTE